jgi:soluble lytic murein transglycosylase-like protein
MPVFAASPSQSLPPHHTTTVVRVDPKNGRLVRSVVLSVIPPAHPISSAKITEAAPTLPASPAANSNNLTDLIDGIAAAQGVENHLVHSVIRAESNYNANAVSAKGAQGIMQLIPSTARRFGVSNAFDPSDNIRGGVRYLKFLLDYYQGDYVRTIAAYNAGEGAVDKYNGIPPYAETRNYVYRVAKDLKAARQSPSKPAADPAPAEFAAQIARSETTRPVETSTGPDGLIYYRTP